MKVLNLVTTPRPFFNQQCHALQKHGVEMTTICVPGRDSQLENRSIYDYFRFYPHTLRHSVKDFDLVHAHFGLTAPFAITQPIRPIVISLWGTDLDGKYGRISEFCTRFANDTIVPNEKMATKLKVDAHVIRQGIDLQKFSPQNQVKSQEICGWDPNKSHILFPYPPSKEVKNYPLAKKVVEEVNTQIEKEIRLQVVYDEPYSKIPTYMNAADALLVTSKREAGPNTIREALASNLPVVSTNVGNAKKLTAEAELSMVGEDKSELVWGIKKILDDRELASERKAIEHRTWDSTAQDIMRIYRNLV